MPPKLAWFKSSYSDNTGGECVEVALPWRKSSHSDSGGGDCVEIAAASAIHIRDSKFPNRPHLTVTSTAWTEFVGVARREGGQERS
jgi:hypothetical protein